MSEFNCWREVKYPSGTEATEQAIGTADPLIDDLSIEGHTDLLQQQPCILVAARSRVYGDVYTRNHL